MTAAREVFHGFNCIRITLETGPIIWRLPGFCLHLRDLRVTGQQFSLTIIGCLVRPRTRHGFFDNQLGQQSPKAMHSRTKLWRLGKFGLRPHTPKTISDFFGRSSSLFAYCFKHMLRKKRIIIAYLNVASSVNRSAQRIELYHSDSGHTFKVVMQLMDIVVHGF
jgi:hypothetical protein